MFSILKSAQLAENGVSNNNTFCVTEFSHPVFSSVIVNVIGTVDVPPPLIIISAVGFDSSDTPNSPVVPNSHK